MSNALELSILREVDGEDVSPELQPLLLEVFRLLKQKSVPEEVADLVARFTTRSLLQRLPRTSMAHQSSFSPAFGQLGRSGMSSNNSLERTNGLRPFAAQLMIR
jgi:hypothetical protein